MISIIISTYGKNYEDLAMMLKCLKLQREYHRKTPAHLKKPVEFLAGDYLDGNLRIGGIELIVASHGWLEKSPSSFAWEDFDRVIETPYDNSTFGHPARDLGIEAATGDWIVLTSSDNLFTAGWLYHLLQAIKQPKAAMVHWEIVNNYWRWGISKHYRRSRIERGWVDICSVAIRADIAKEVGFPFRNFDGDADYILACEKLIKARKLKTIYLPYILAVHQ